MQSAQRWRGPCALGALLLAGGGAWLLLRGADGGLERLEGEAEALPAVVDIERAPPAFREIAGEQVDLRVRVSLGGGPPPEQTEIRLADHGPGCGTARLRRAKRASPGPDGLVVFRGAFPGEYTLHATAPGLPHLSRQVSLPGWREVRFDFPAGREVAGLAVDERGRPVPGARVYLFEPGPALAGQWTALCTDSHGRFAHARRSMQVGEDGRFSFRGLPAGTLALAADGFDAVLGQAVRVGAGAREVRVPVPVAGRIAGRVDLPWWSSAGQVWLEIRRERRAERRSFMDTPDAAFEQLFEPVRVDGWEDEYRKDVSPGSFGRFDVHLPLAGAFRLRSARHGCSGPWVQASLGDRDVLVPPPTCPPGGA
ncbi:MAG TPA: carboxypeptidase-like regulatory domain-containing protein [Myxococcota bacterium]|nr:carboxypeptidase-like regulatory domain-containing protein [Myxococcota bacterium]HRY93448.1 carboxypeptidase-like regulatory domain-containing protein [Myxococcota bacterium]